MVIYLKPKYNKKRKSIMTILATELMWGLTITEWAVGVVMLAFILNMIFNVLK